MCAVAALALLLGGACRSPVGVDRTGFEANFAEQRASVLDGGAVSATSLQLLSILGLEEAFAEDPEDALQQLETRFAAEKRRRPFAALAELSHQHARVTGDPGGYLLSALYAYYYLFSDELEPEPDPYDPLFRLACDIYNRSLALALLDESGEVITEDRVVETPRGPFELTERRPGFPWGKEEFSTFLPSDAYRVRGLNGRVRSSGLGVPLIAVRNATAVDDPRSKHLAPNLKLAATAILRPDGGLKELSGERLSGSLELYFPVDATQVELEGRQAPLESDLSVPLAYSLEDSPIWGFSILGFRRGGDEMAKTGVFLTQPYQPGKIPVLLLHGTASTPAEWASLLNGVLVDPEVRSNYQLWVGLYHTGNPVLYSASGIRKSLAAVVADLDPDGDDEALSKMVLVGHSQGGLVARLLSSSSEDEFWKIVSSEPFEDYDLSPEAREVVGSSMFFEPLPFISRVIFIATPHGGSHFAAGWVGQIARTLVEAPSDVTNSVAQLRRGDRLPQELRESVPTSVHNMDPDSPFVKALNGLEFAPEVRVNSIVAVKGDGPKEEGDDGIVAYGSAHLDQAESEFVVRSGHSCQSRPETVLEVRRILLEHLRVSSPPE